ncbi:polysaccharide biosynthesis/export family protein [Segnochrobactrum spirostomi]|uniref:Polysaccharide export protein n=1 Tax=Segnochrobactrum spirostomi TaxID=2608987 RepID=A0A6A7YAF0_9HYPH|nr:polysaccharide biosynthesis/export family protein [Segnochrobactrum spirostomi]MQT15297.1 polysaccharide export protein [Segnochrobactrum spirostomi]
MRGSVAATALALVLAGCGIPKVGPSASEVLNTANQAKSNYIVVDITPSVVSALRSRPPEGFSQRFGDYRSSVEPRIGVGDTLSVTIWEAGAGGLFTAPLTTEKFSTGSKSATIPNQIVGRDGTITVPFAGNIPVVGKTPGQVQTEIESALVGKADQPQALVSVLQAVSSSVTVTGEVANGARVPLSMKGDRILDVIAAAGGLRAPVNETTVELSRNGKTATMPLIRIVTDPRENIFVRPGDSLVLVRDPLSFLAYGATGANAEIPFQSDRLTLAQALVKAGGLQDYRADPAGVFIFRYEPASIARQLAPTNPAVRDGTLTPIVYRINMRNPDSLFLIQQFEIQNKDVLYVSNASLTDTQKALQIFNMIASPTATGASIYSAVK